ncbi:hypothetical protein DL93DRAFT_2073860 [Clavulina sp. PMI_390]|nr:hypothetical protein DL93DRAFT_2073860 [Clavulina sp. PMI_390]
MIDSINQFTDGSGGGAVPGDGGAAGDGADNANGGQLDVLNMALGSGSENYGGYLNQP